MKRYIQFYCESTGYVKGSVPPNFDGPKYPIEAVGSDGVFVPDQRLNNLSLHVLARNIIESKRKNKIRDFVGYSIEQSSRFTKARGKFLSV